ncbi:prepilin-type N-terminal cleavage/methylation domain-containing protein [Thermus sp.]
MRTKGFTLIELLIVIAIIRNLPNGYLGRRKP